MGCACGDCSDDDDVWGNDGINGGKMITTKVMAATKITTKLTTTMTEIATKMMTSMTRITTQVKAKMTRVGKKKTPTKKIIRKISRMGNIAIHISQHNQRPLGKTQDKTTGKYNQKKKKNSSCSIITRWQPHASLRLITNITTSLSGNHHV